MQANRCSTGPDLRPEVDGQPGNIATIVITITGSLACRGLQNHGEPVGFGAPFGGGLSGRCGASVGQPILVASDGERYDARRALADQSLAVACRYPCRALSCDPQAWLWTGATGCLQAPHGRT